MRLNINYPKFVGRTADACITIAWQLDSGDEPVLEFFHFDIKELQDGTCIPLFCTQDGNGFEFCTYEVSKADISKIKKAIYNFTALANFISKNF